MINTMQKNVCEVNTNDIRFYLSNYQDIRNSSKATLDNIRRIISSFFSWLEDENYILKSPARRIHKVKSTQFVKETLSDEELERLRDQCRHSSDLAMIDLLISTGIRVGELVNLNRSDINFPNGNALYWEREIRNEEYTLMPEPRSICSIILPPVRIQILHCSSVLIPRGAASLSPV